jgi:hypothetical protein
LTRIARLGAAVATAMLLAILLGAAPGSGGRLAASLAADAGQAPTAGDGFETVLGLPALAGFSEHSLILIGASPKEGDEEVWAYGGIGDVPANVGGASYADQNALLEHTASGWQVLPLPPGPKGEPLSPLGEDTFPDGLGPFGGRAIADGGVALLTGGGIVLRDPGGQPRLAAGLETTPGLLGKDESIPPHAPEGAPTAYAAVEDQEHTGILIAPYGDGADAASEGTVAGVLHYDGVRWTREPLEGPSAGAESGLIPEALACGGTAATDTNASAPTNCWLLAAYKSEPSVGSPNRLALFRRFASAGEPSKHVWRQQAVAGGLLGEQSSSTSATALGRGAQMLTVTSQGVWVDFEAQVNGSTVQASELVTPAGEGLATAGKWCYPPIASVCPQSLGAALPTPYERSPYESFAWSGAGEDPGTRIITGLPDGAMLELSGGRFTYTVGAGGQVEGLGGAAFDSPREGWVAEGHTGISGGGGQGQAQVIHITPQPQGDQLREEPVPFRHPLLALAQAPGSTPGDPGAQALAVGLQGQIARYTPGEGWRPEALYDEAGKVQTPTLRGVAWPEPGRAYAVGDGGAMWVWQAATGLWEPDPAKPYGFIANLNAIAFSPSDPSLGYAVGKGGTLLRYGKTWEPEAPPKELGHPNFTSVAFAGDEALATYRTVIQEPNTGKGPREAGGVIVSEGGGPWRVDQSAAALLGSLPHPRDTMLTKVAGLPDGGAVAAGPGLVIERDSSTAPWRFSPEPLPEAESVSALGAYRDASGAVRAFVSIDLDESLDPDRINGGLESGPYAGDLEPPPTPGEPPYRPPPDPLPDDGYLLKETASGWSDMEHMALPTRIGGDLPVRPDSVYALLVDPTGNAGLAVGGLTLGSVYLAESLQTAAALRFGAAGAAVPGNAPAPIVTSPTAATFAVGGDAACENECADFANEGLGPDVSLAHALASAGQIAATSPGGLRGFLYTGRRLASRPEGEGLEAGERFERELARYASLLGSASVPVHATASPNDLAPNGEGIDPFASILAQFLPGAQSGAAYYSFLSTGASGGEVAVIVLDYSSGALGETQQTWLEAQLRSAKKRGTPAIVLGNASPGLELGIAGAPLQAQDAEALTAILVTGSRDPNSQCRCGASAYLFDYPGANVQAQLTYGEEHIPAFGTGTLGYTPAPFPRETDYLGSSGFLLLEVETARRDLADNVAPVSVRSEPNIGLLALDATDGTLLRRSQVALFEALARRPPQGLAISQESSGLSRPAGSLYEQIPYTCLGAHCPYAIPTDYTFASSNPDIGDFVAHDPTSANPREVLLGANQLPVPDPRSGLFCAFNAGTTTVTITTGGLSYSEPVTVQAGSVEYPCGTVPLKNPPPRDSPLTAGFQVPSLAPAGAPPTNPLVKPVTSPPPPAPAAKQPSHPVHPPRPAPLAIVPLAPVQLFPLIAVVPPPAPSAARPTPPSGTAQVPAQSPVSQTVGVAEGEEEEEGATEVVHHMVAYRHHPEEGPLPAWPLGLVLLAVAAGMGILRSKPDLARVGVSVRAPREVR